LVRRADGYVVGPRRRRGPRPGAGGGAHLRQCRACTPPSEQLVQMRSWARSWPPRCHAGGEWSDPGGTKWHPQWHLTPTNLRKRKRCNDLQGATTSLILGAICVAPCGTQMAPCGTLVAPSGTEGLRPAPSRGAPNRGMVRSWDPRPAAPVAPGAAGPTTGPAISLLRPYPQIAWEDNPRRATKAFP
jgi:hypothetical protein